MMFYDTTTTTTQQPTTLYEPRPYTQTDIDDGARLNLGLTIEELDDTSSSGCYSVTSSPQQQLAVPRKQRPRDYEPVDLDAFLDALGDVDTSMLTSGLMPQDSWLNNASFPARPRQQAHHARDSSLSSLNSTGPASPFSATTTHPHIAVTDSAGEWHGLHTGLYDEHAYAAAGLAKSLPGNNGEAFYANHAGYAPDATAPAGFALRRDRGLLPPPELSVSSNRSRPVSVASSIAGGDSPATPAMEPDHHEEGRRTKAPFPHIPKLDRTMTDVYSDELYNPNLVITSSAPTSLPQLSSANDLFSQRLQAVNSQHLSAGGSPVSGSRMSPFRQGSPLAPTASHDFAGQVRFNSAQQLRQQQKAEQDARAAQAMQYARSQNNSTPQTISPKDAMLEFSSDGNDFPLFPQSQPGQNFMDDAMSKPAVAPATQAYDYSYLASTMPTSLHVPQQYPFIRQPTAPSTSLSVPERVSSAESSTSEASSALSRPTAMSADGGTYTCTYHGCTRRFDTPQLLQKHKREGHRQAHGLNGPRRPDSSQVGATEPVMDTQAGPHRCDRINPSTGKPCSTVFSRPYDLTRHEDTIHNARKMKVRCDLCTEEKTFSRADALTRHYRVCHPDVEFHGRRRKH